MVTLLETQNLILFFLYLSLSSILKSLSEKEG